VEANEETPLERILEAFLDEPFFEIGLHEGASESIERTTGTRGDSAHSSS